jgi:hypothetical protein
MLFKREHAGGVRLPYNLQPRTLEDRNDRPGDLRSDAVTGNERNGVGH